MNNQTKLLIFAHKKEAEAFFLNYHFTPLSFMGLNLYQGKIQHLFFLLLISGPGPIYVRDKTLAILNNFSKINEVINLGVAGSTGLKFNLNDLLWVHTTYALLNDELEKENFKSSTKDTLVSCLSLNFPQLEPSEKNKLSTYADIIDCELWGIASATYHFGLSFQSLKLISDDLSSPPGLIFQSIKKEASFFSKKLFIEFQAKYLSDDKC